MITGETVITDEDRGRPTAPTGAAPDGGPGRDGKQTGGEMDDSARSPEAGDGSPDGTRGDPDADAPSAPGEATARRPAGPTFTRREFAAGAGAALLAPVAARLSPWYAADVGPRPGRLAAEGRIRPMKRPDGSRADAAAGRQEAGEEPAGTEALVDYVEARWGDLLSAEDREQVRASVAGNLRAASALDEVELQNADEPAFAFSPYRGGSAQ